MIARFLLLVLALAVPSGSAQMGVYGTVAAHVKAGDRAPDVAFTKVLSAPVAGSWSQTNLSGQLTVLAFMPDTSHNLQTVTLWNDLVEKFSDQPIQFLWITGESESTLLPWLEAHPISGWVLLDSPGRTGNAYGMELPENVIVGADRRIVGFYMGTTETESLLEAVKDGRTTTARPDKATMKAFMESGKVLIDAEPERIPRLDDQRPAFPPSYTVHVSLSHGDERGNFGGDDYWVLKGYSLKEAIEQLYEVNSIRLHLPASLDNSKRYDFALVLPKGESRETMKERMRQGLQGYFQVSATRENRLVDVYVVSVVPGRRPPALEATQDGLGARHSGIQFGSVEGAGEVLEELKPQSVSAIRAVYEDGTVNEFCHRLEGFLDRPVVNETGLEGEFKLYVKSSEGEENDFLGRLRDELGLVITPGQRNVEMLVFEPH